MSGVTFDERILQFSGYLKPVALGFTKDVESAKDLIQETYYKALSNKDKFREGTNLKAWLYTIMKNIFINKYRRKKKTNVILDTTESNYYINSAARDTPNEGEVQLNMKDLNKAINKLHQEYREPFSMHFKGYKYKEIADHLDLPIGTVKSRIHLARKNLKDRLEKYQSMSI